MPKVCRSCCTAAPCGRLCFPVTSSCAPNPGVAGASVAVSKSGAAVGTATTSSQVTATTKISGGSGYTSPPTVSFTGGGGSGAAGTVTVTFGQVGTLTLTSGGTGYTSAPTVVFTGGGGTGASFTATIGMQACIPITSSGTTGQYTYSISASGYTTKTGSLGAVTCAGTTTTSTAVQLSPTTATATINATSNCFRNTNYVPSSQVPGCSVTVNGSPAGTTDSTGRVFASVPANTAVPYTVSKAGWTTFSGTIPAAACSVGVTATMVPDASHTSVTACLEPVPATLTLTDSVFGAVTITSAGGSCDLGWSGSISATSLGTTSCPARAMTLTYSFAGGGGGAGDRGTITVQWTVDPTDGICPGAGPTTGSLGYAVDSLTCPPSFTAHSNGQAAGLPSDHLPWGTSPATFSIVG